MMDMTNLKYLYNLRIYKWEVHDYRSVYKMDMILGRMK